MRKNPYVVEKAKERLDSQVRSTIEASIERFEADSGEEGYEQLVEGLTTSIEVIEELRGSLLGN